MTARLGMVLGLLLAFPVGAWWLFATRVALGSGGATGSAMDSIVAEQEAVNQGAVNLVRSFGLDVEVSGDTVLGAPAYALVGAAHPDDIIVVGATSHPGRLTEVLGSVATVIAHRAHCPVVVLRPDDRKAA